VVFYVHVRTLKLVPGGEFAGIEYEAIPILLFGLAGFLMVLIPFLEKVGKNLIVTAVVFMPTGRDARATGSRRLANRP